MSDKTKQMEKVRSEKEHRARRWWGRGGWGCTNTGAFGCSKMFFVPVRVWLKIRICVTHQHKISNNGNLSAAVLIRGAACPTHFSLLHFLFWIHIKQKRLVSERENSYVSAKVKTLKKTADIIKCCSFLFFWCKENTVYIGFSLNIHFKFASLCSVSC